MKLIEEIFKLIFKILEGLLGFAFEFLSMLFTNVPKKTTGYHADFAAASSLLSASHTGFSLTGKRNLSVKDSYTNALIIGGTGTGKSSVVLIPSIYSMQSSFIIHDPSGELYRKTSGQLKSRGYEVLLLNFANPPISFGYNPLARANNSSEIQKVASLLIDNAFGQRSKDPFWNTQATALLSMLIGILKKQDSCFQNLANVRHLLNQLGSSPKSIDALFSKDADEVLFSEYKSFIAYDDKVVNGVIATAKAALQIFSDESVAKVTVEDTISFSDFRKKKVALFIQNSVADQKYYSVLTSIFFEQLFSFLLGRFAESGEHDVFMLIDEASSLNLPTLPLAVANLRKHRAGTMLLIQDFAQLVHHYGKYDAEAIRSNCFAKMYFTGQSLETSAELEKTLGKFEYEDEDGKKMVRSLMTNDEIRTMKSSRALLVCGNHPPILAKLVPYYKRSQYKKFSELPVPKLNGNNCSSAVSLLELKKPAHA